VVAIVAAQEFQWVFTATKRTGSGAGVWFVWTKTERRVGIYYLSVGRRSVKGVVAVLSCLVA
jgi:hypothetical protein